METLPNRCLYIVKDVNIQNLLLSSIHETCTFESLNLRLLHPNCYCNYLLFIIQVYKRLKLTLELVKKEMEISKIQVLHSIVYVLLICVKFFNHNYILTQSFPLWVILKESIAKAIEEKISGEQRRYLLNEQLKAIKKVLSPVLYIYYTHLCILFFICGHIAASLESINLLCLNLGQSSNFHGSSWFRNWGWRQMTKQHFLVSSVFLFFEIVSRLFSNPKDTVDNLDRRSTGNWKLYIQGLACLVPKEVFVETEGHTLF